MPTSPANPELVFSLRRVTESAAIAAFSWIGRGDSQDGGRAALEAMRAALADVDIDAVVAIGEATKGEAPQPQRGERLGRAGAVFKADIAVDPVEGTSYLVRGQTNALAVLAVAPRGAMLNPGPAFYMEKFVASAPARGKIDPHWPVEKKLTGLAEALAALRLRPLALGRLADHHHGVDIDLGESAAHGIKPGAGSLGALASSNPVESGAGSALGDEAEGKDERRIDRTRGLHNGSLNPSRFGAVQTTRLVSPTRPTCAL